MEVPGSSPAPAASAPPPASAPAAVPSAPASPSSTPAQPTPYGKLNPSKTQDIFNRLDAESATPAAGEEIPVAKVPGSEPSNEPAPTADPALEAAAGEGELPQKVRDALKVLNNKPLENALAEAYHVTREIKKTGLPVATIRQFIQDAPKYLEVAPSLDVLQHMAETSAFATDLGTGFVDGSTEGYQKFTGALLQSNPQSFVGYADFLLRNSDKFVAGLSQHYGAEVAGAFARATDSFRDEGNRNVIQNMRAIAEAAEKNGKPDDEVWAEVADKMEEFLRLKENDQPRANRPDPRDEKIRRLETEKQQQAATHVAQFTDGVFNTAGHHLEGKVASFLDSRIKGYPDEARADILELVSKKLYSELLENKHIKARARAIENSGRYDRDHFQKLSKFYIETGERLIGNIAAPILNKYAKITAPRRTEEKERLDRHQARRDPGASGGPPSAAAVKPLSSYKSPKDIFAALDAQAGDNG